ncbi:Cellulose synthase-like CSLG, family GT2 [Zostera marina]|uniref:Cellulose synthase-like CSLG, family GT2 n=1 Tax=Zostera marina TaxID=29655 RepID=A0A0K9Q622_ZOSMR|nr:Cellulose synthase-like CSLG, family GT2 [Zostera marina]
MENSGEDLRALPLHTCHADPLIRFYRFYLTFYTIAILTLFYHHILQLLSSTSVIFFCLYISLFFSNIILAVNGLSQQSLCWYPVHRRTYPERLPNKELPGLDVFICTADPYKEPPMGVVNTALSVMAYDYPVEKLSVYLSDDGGSDLTRIALSEAVEFAKHWLPFCRQNNVYERSPEAYFRSNNNYRSEHVKILYQEMKVKVENQIINKSISKSNLAEHPSVIQVLLKTDHDLDVSGHPLPNVIYVSREKNRIFPHHFKAGALNALLRVSSLMTNAPFILTLDCDMISNDPITPRRAMCFHLDETMAEKLAFVQFPQKFQVNKSDLYGNEFRRLQTNMLGLDGMKSTIYIGTNTFFRRRALMSNMPVVPVPEFANEVVGATYEVNGRTKWGSTVGFRYGSLVEDFFTGYLLHCEGWKSVFCNPKRAAFVGDFPITLDGLMRQAKRWTVGLADVAFSKYCPITFGLKHCSPLLSLAYFHYAFWSIPSIPVIFYGILPQITVVHQIQMFPNIRDPWFWLYFFMFVVSYARDLADFVLAGETAEKWWNDQRMWLVRCVTCWPVGILESFLKKMSYFSSSSSTVGFHVTSKVTQYDSDERYKLGIFDFGTASEKDSPSPYIVSLAVFATMSLVGFTVGTARALKNGKTGDFTLPLLLCGFVVVNSYPIYKAMVFRKDNGRIPWKSVQLAFFITAFIFSFSSCVKL